MLTCPNCDRSGFASEKSLEDHAAHVHTFDEIREAVSNAVRGRRERAWVRDLTSDFVIVTWYDRDSDESTMVKMDYTIDENMAVTLGDEVKVRSRTLYEEDAAAAMPIDGTPSADAPHGFSQDEGSSPLWCSECGRAKSHPVHTEG